MAYDGDSTSSCAYLLPQEEVFIYVKNQLIHCEISGLLIGQPKALRHENDGVYFFVKGSFLKDCCFGNIL
ncbi:hypothetical protein LCY76_05990 [Fictibacillus sp. KIGAM418]|uniref:Uncharacterized protein n=1 Tax=Fictibacillus marinisediminis TaxID=2878389 RepID=A0A9X2BEJ1_9BACL|nr:hypothetical protein [Fictibacillus marinisediminis]MCK6256152.1 hypothetical protein [Fictibacillus marinisediminis]